jgi:hypothetical protein
MSNDISNFSISPAINNRSQYNACGVGCTDTLSTFNLGMYTSGQTNTIGFSLQGANGLDINLNPVKTTRLWINELSSEVSFKVKSDEILTLESLTEDIQINGTMTLDKASTLERKTTIKPESIEVRDTQNDPLGDPIYTQITPNNIIMENGNGSHQIVNLNASALFLRDEDNYPTIAEVTITPASITSTTGWSINSVGGAIFTNLTVDSIPIITPITQSGSTLSIDLGSYPIGESWSTTMTGAINTVVLTNGIIGGIYKIWLTVNGSNHQFHKNCGYLNNLGGNTLMASNTVWLLQIYKADSSLYRIEFQEFT